uniref:ORF3 n=1 Tax=Ascaris lumbricoides TaxID=6252 RepID=A0A0M3HYZ0_ASCLU
MSFVWPFLSGGTQRTRKTLRSRMQRLSQRITRFRPTSFNRKSLNSLRPGSFSRASLYRIRQNRRKYPDVEQPLCMQPTSSNFRQDTHNSQLPPLTTVSQISEHERNVKISKAPCE